MNLYWVLSNMYFVLNTHNGYELLILYCGTMTMCGYVDALGIKCVELRYLMCTHFYWSYY